MAAPAPIDPRGPRFNQAVLAFALLGGFLFDWRPVVPVFALVLLAGAALGPRYGPFLALYGKVIRPRLSPPHELEDPRPPRFAAAVGVTFLTAATLAFAAGSTGVGWALALVVAALAGLSAVTGICVGCEIYLLAARRRPLTGLPPRQSTLDRPPGPVSGLPPRQSTLDRPPGPVSGLPPRQSTLDRPPGPVS